MPQTKAQRSTAAKKAAVTRKRNTAKRTDATVKTPARQTGARIETAARSIGRTAEKASRSVLQHADAELTRLRPGGKRTTGGSRKK
jgi:hypothetical protein